MGTRHDPGRTAKPTRRACIAHDAWRTEKSPSSSRLRCPVQSHAQNQKETTPIVTTLRTVKTFHKYVAHAGKMLPKNVIGPPQGTTATNQTINVFMRLGYISYTITFGAYVVIRLSPGTVNNSHAVPRTAATSCLLYTSPSPRD